ncbi:hypothetical protein PS2_032739 [Malus domestica]
MATGTYLFFTLIIASSLCSFGVSRVEPQKVTLSVYYETLCPYCATFIEKNLARIFDKGLITILNLRLVPWGNMLLQPRFIRSILHFIFLMKFYSFLA